MSNRTIVEVLRSLDKPAEPSAEFAESLSQILLNELAREAEPELKPFAARVFGRPGARLRNLVPVVAVVILLAGLLVWNVSRPQSAFAVVEEAIARSRELPPFRAVIVGPKGEVPLARLELLYRGKDGWRLKFVEVTPSSPTKAPGSFELRDGNRYYSYSAADNTYQSGSNIGAGFSPLGLLSWDSHGGIGFWRDRCGESASRVLGNDEAVGRPAKHVRCTDLELWIDTETGLILRIKSLESPAAAPRPVPGPIGLLPGTTVEITEIEYNPSFPPGAFEFLPPPGATESQGEPEPDTPVSDRLKVGETAARWSGELLTGGSFDTQSLRGRPAVIFFWAPWCFPCIDDPFTQFQAAYRKHSSALGLVSVSFDKREPTQEIVNKNLVEFPVVLDEKGTNLRRWGLRGIPALVLLDDRGRVLRMYVGPLSNDDFEQLVDAVAAGRPLPDVSPRP